MKGGLHNTNLRQTATLIVAAVDSLYPDRADYPCDGAADDVRIQGALDALPATGGSVILLDGTYYIAASIVLGSYQTLKGQGRNTILTASAANVDIITAVGGAGTEKIGILIADLCVDGDAGGQVNDIGILFTYVDNSRIEGCWIRDNGESGIYLDVANYNTIMGNICEGNEYGMYLEDADDNTITGNTCKGNDYDGISLYRNNHNNTVTGNTCQGNTYDGLWLSDGTNNTVVGNTCQGNTRSGIELDNASNNTFSGNTCADNGWHGIFIANLSNQNVITGNQCNDNGAGGTYHGIWIYVSSYCTVVGNVCNNNLIDGIMVEGAGPDNADYNSVTGNVCYNNGDDGIEIAGGVNANKNIVLGNQLLGNAGTALVDNGVGTEIGHNISV